MATVVYCGARRYGKTWAAATRLGMSMDEYREMMRRQRERIDAARALTPPPPAGDFFRMLWDEGNRPHCRQTAFMREYLCEFESPAPEPMGPPAPTFEQRERSQRQAAEIERKGGGWVFNWTEI